MISQMAKRKIKDVISPFMLLFLRGQQHRAHRAVSASVQYQNISCEVTVKSKILSFDTVNDFVQYELGCWEGRVCALKNNVLSRGFKTCLALVLC